MGAMTTALILFGHGARDARWREPFDRLVRMLSEQHPGPVSPAFLELMQPDLETACREAAAKGAQRVVVVPLFIGTGGHIRRDLPLLMERAAAACGLPVSAAAPAGEDEAVLQALAGYCLASVL